MSRIGWIGLGNMGAAMAKNIQRHLASLSPSGQSALKIFNRSAARMATVSELGAVACRDVVEVVEGSDTVFISTSDDAALESIIDQVLQVSDLTGKIIVDTTTVHPDTTRAVAEKLEKRQASFVAAPCFGATPVAEEGKLLMAAGGPAKAVDQVVALIQGVLAREVIRVGEEAEKASLLKTSGNFIIAGIMELVGEALVFAEKTGLGTDTVQLLIKANFGPLAYSDSIRMMEGVYMPGKDQQPWSDLNLALKDMSHVQTSARSVAASLPVADLIVDHLRRAKTYADEEAPSFPFSGGHSTVGNGDGKQNVMEPGEEEEKQGVEKEEEEEKKKRRKQKGGRAMDSSSLYGAIRLESGLRFETDYVRERDGIV